MSKTIFQKLTDISTSQKVIRTIVLTIIATSCLTIITVSLIFFKLLNDKSQNIYLIDSSGSIFSAERVSMSKMRPLEAQAHVKSFLDLFFNMNKLNIDTQLTHAYDLGGEEIHKFRKLFENENWYKQIKQYNIIQHSTIKKLEYKPNTYPYQVNAIIHVTVISNISETTVYEIEIDFNVKNKNGDRHLSNIHNMDIDYIDVLNWQKIIE